jgi:hypothetical protein
MQKNVVIRCQNLLKSSLERVFTAASVSVKDVASKDDGVGLRELGIGAGVDGSVTTRVASFNPNGCGVVLGIERTFGNSIANACGKRLRMVIFEFENSCEIVW